MDSQNHQTQIQPVVHCGNLSSKTTSADLQTLFSKVAPVVKINLKKRNDSVSSFAFVYFMTVQDAENIVKEFNYTELHGKQINLMLYNADKGLPDGANIFVKNLPPNLNSKDLNEIFKMFGQIVSCKVASDDNGSLKGFGYVQYKNPKSAKKAILSCQNVKIGTHTLEVELYDPKLKSSKESKENPKVSTFTNCYVKNFPLSMTEEKLKKILEKYGKIDSLFFPKNENGVTVGYACANFSTPDEAKKAIEALHNKELFTSEEMEKEEGLTSEPFYIQKAENKKERVEILKKQHEKLMLEGQRSKRNLYVSNIPDTFTKDEIKNIFLRFGTITDFKISKCAGSNKQYAYVCYSTPEEACIAFEKLDGTSLDENKLQISYYKTKSERIAENDKNLAESLVMLKSLSVTENSDYKSHGSNKKTLQILHDALITVAPVFKHDWHVFNATSSVEFAQEILKEISNLPSGFIKSISTDSRILEDNVKKIIFEKKNQESLGLQ